MLNEQALPVTVLVLLFVAVVLLLVLWILLPFAVFGVKPLIRQVMALQQRTNELLQRAEDDRRASAVLAERQRQGAITDAEREVMFGKTQFQKR